MTPSMMSSYAAMKGRNADIEHDVLYGALYENKERHPDDVRVWLPRFDNMTANLYGPSFFRAFRWLTIKQICKGRQVILVGSISRT